MPYRIFSTTLTPDSWYVNPTVGWTTTLADATTYATEQEALDVIAAYGMFAIAVNNPAGISGDVIGPSSSATGNLAGFSDGTGKNIADSLISPTTITAAIAASGTGFVSGPASSATGNALSFFGGTGKVAKDSGLQIVAPGGTADFGGHKLTLTADSWIGGTAATGADVAFSGARVYNSSGTSFGPTVVRALNFNSERFDTDAYHSTVSNNDRLTTPATGAYLIGANLSVSFAYDTTPSMVTAQIKDQDGVAIASASQAEYAGGPQTRVQQLNLSCVTYSVGNRYFTLVITAGPDSLDVQANAGYSPEFYITKLG